MKAAKDNIFFFHIPKCAGMSIWAAIWDIVGYRNTLQVGTREQREAFEKMPLIKAAAYRGIGGHGWLNLYRSKLGDMKDYHRITIIRDPIDRIVSEYNFISNLETHVRHDKVKQMNFEEFSRVGEAHVNMLTRLLSSEERGAPNVDKAIDRLETWFDDYCLFPDIDDLVGRLYTAFGKRQQPAEHKNKSSRRVKPTEIDPGILARLREIHAADVELYSRLMAKRDAKAAERQAKIA